MPVAFRHPQTHGLLWLDGRELKPTEVREIGDLHSSPDGTWQPCPPGKVGWPLKHCECGCDRRVMWLRPTKKAAPMVPVDGPVLETEAA